MSKAEMLLLGVDFGSSKIALRSNRGYEYQFPALVGYPKDMISLRLLKKGQVFGVEAESNREALVCYQPLENGLLREQNFFDYNSAYELLKHVVEGASQAQNYSKVCGVVGVPARASQHNKEYFHQIAAQLFDVALIVSEPFMVAYELNQLSDAIIVDIGAGTIDICAMRGQVPRAADQVTLLKAGNHIDHRLYTLLEERHPELQTTAQQLRKIKEEHGFVGEYGGEVVVTMREDGRPVEVNITEELRIACEAILPDILEQLVIMVQSFDPQRQHVVLENIYLAGGGSKITGIDELIALHLVEYGDVHVQCIDNDGVVGAAGALKLAHDLPPEVWNQVGYSNGDTNLNGLIGGGQQS